MQEYAALVARALLTSVKGPPSEDRATTLLFSTYGENWKALKDRFGKDLEAEDAVLKTDNYEQYQALAGAWPHVGNSAALEVEAAALRNAPKTFPYRLASITFAYGYFGLRQAMQFDSLRYAIDCALEAGHISEEEWRWFLLALLQAASHIVSAPGHFAQFFRVRDLGTYKRVRRLRRRSVWERFLSELEQLAPYGSINWRQNNRIFRQDAGSLLNELSSQNNRPKVAYADPPYSKDMYSRYYHVPETLVLYDYPISTGAGRYRGERFSTPFSMVSSVKEAFTTLIEGVAELGAELVLSYPEVGFLHQTGADLPTMLGNSYGDIRVVSVDHVHSTLGGNPGHSRWEVKEMIYVATNPK